jgi:hypothetical protein
MRGLATYLSVVQRVLIELVVGFAVAVGQLPVATISGLVVYPTGAAIANAEIIVRQPDTGFERKLSTKADGTFRVDNLQPGTYEIEANCQGFIATWRRVTLQVGDYITVKFEPQPGLVEQKVEVGGEISGVNRTDYKVDGSVNRLQIENLPLNGRSFLELAQLEPGVNVESVINPGAYGNNYDQPNYGQPRARVGQVLAAGGPRAFQFAVRFMF